MTDRTETAAAAIMAALQSDGIKGIEYTAREYRDLLAAPLDRHAAARFREEARKLAQLARDLHETIEAHHRESMAEAAQVAAVRANNAAALASIRKQPAPKGWNHAGEDCPPRIKLDGRLGGWQD
jgi:hypothetical protein